MIDPFSKGIRLGRLQPVTLADLANSGLTRHDARKLRIREVSVDEMRALGGKPCGGYALPYFDLRGKATDFTRYKYIVPPEKLEDWVAAKFPKYHSVSGKGNRLYFPPLHRQLSWEAILKDPKVRIAITEGEKKAAKATKCGLPTIGISGVWNWVAKGRNPILDLKLINFEQREVALIFDSDIANNQNVDMALTALAGEIIRRGGKPFRITLPETLEGL